MKISIVTPTYNRKNELNNLYVSLKNQINKKFNWIIINDGSDDNTEEIINSFILENKIEIEYLKKKNGGKHSAINYFLDNSKAHRELIFFVDSDDTLTTNATDIIYNEYEKIKNKSDYSGLCFLKINKITNKTLSKRFPQNSFDSNVFNIIKKYKIYGDKAEVFFFEELVKYRFPIFPEEKFMSELYIWMELSKNKKIRYVNKEIYIAEYQSDGYTKNFKKILKLNPIGMKEYYKKVILESRFGYKMRLKSICRYFQIICLTLMVKKK